MQRRNPALIPSESRAVARDPRALTKDARQRALEAEYRAGTGAVNMDEYYSGVLKQFRDDSSIMDPMGIAPTSVRVSGGPAVGDAQALVQQTLEASASNAVLARIDAPFGHSAIEDLRIWFDTRGRSFAYNGFTNGEIQFQLNDFNNCQPPIRVIQITLEPFRFPRIYLPNYLDYDAFYLGRAYMWLRFLPLSDQSQTATPGIYFTFELDVAALDISFVLMTPLKPVISLRQPVNLTSNVSFKFMNCDPFAGLVDISIPPTRILVRRSLSHGPPGTTFYLIPPMFIGVLGPIGVASTALVRFMKSTPGPVTPLEAYFVGNVYTATNFQGVAGPPPFIPTFSFDIPISSFLIPGSGEEFYVDISRNAIGFSMQFASSNPSKTNDLVPVYL